MKTKLLALAAPAFAAGLLFLAAGPSSAQSQTITPDLAGIPAEQGWKFVNRAATRIDRNGAMAVRLEGNGGPGFVRLENLAFGDGTIEFDARGKNAPQQSFLGVAFHGADAKTYDAVYFRPFNFNPADAARRRRAVQYISHPAHTWQKLREQFPGKYENAVAPVPDPDGWFHVRLVIAWPKVSVFVDAAAEPSLSVDQLSDRKRGWIGLWVDVNGGDFANLKITPSP